MLRRFSLGVMLAVGALLTPMVASALPAGTLLAQAGASRVVMDDGTVIEGEITAMTADEVVVKTASGTRTVARARVVRIEFGAATAATPAPPPVMTPPPATPPPPQPTPPPEGWSKPGTSATPVPAPTPVGERPGPREPGAERVGFGRAHPAFVFNGFLGGKTLNEDWEPVGGQVAMGVEMTFLPLADLPLGFALDAGFASGSAQGETPATDDITYSATMAELDVGVRFLQEIDPQLPIALSIGGGVSSVSASYSARNDFTNEEIFDDGDGGVGLWASTGMHVRLLEFLNIGATVRWSSSTVELFGEEIDPGGVSFAMTAGFSFGFPEQYRRTRRVYVSPARRVYTPAPSPSGVREMWLTTPWGGQQYVAVGQWVVIERSDGPTVSGRVNRLFPDAIEIAADYGLVTIPTNRVMRISGR